MNSSFDKADKVAEDLVRLFGKHPSLNGIAIKHNKEDGFYVEIRFLPGSDLPTFDYIEGDVKIVTSHREMAVARRGLPK